MQEPDNQKWEETPCPACGHPLDVPKSTDLPDVIGNMQPTEENQEMRWWWARSVAGCICGVTIYIAP